MTARLRLAARPLLVAASLAGCLAPPTVPGPEPLAPESVWAVRITPLPPDPRPIESIVAPGEVRAIAASEAFGAQGWTASDAGLRPRFQIELLGGDGARASYWLGTDAPPPHPFAARGSGWWIAPAAPPEAAGAPLYKGLPESVASPLLEALDLR